MGDGDAAPRAAGAECLGIDPPVGHKVPRVARLPCASPTLDGLRNAAIDDGPERSLLHVEEWRA